MALLSRTSLLIAPLVLMLVSAVTGQTIDRLVAVVGGDPIFLSDVRQAEQLRLIDPDGVLAAVTADTNVPASQQPLERLINRRLVLAEAMRYLQPQPPSADVDRALEIWSARFASDAERDAAIDAAAGGSLAVVRAFLADSLRIDRYLDQRFIAAAQPTREEARAFHQANLASFARGGVPAPFQEVEDIARARLSEQRRRLLVRDWLAAVRNRAQVQVVSGQRD